MNETTRKLVIRLAKRIRVVCEINQPIKSVEEALEIIFENVHDALEVDADEHLDS